MKSKGILVLVALAILFPFTKVNAAPGTAGQPSANSAISGAKYVAVKEADDVTDRENDVAERGKQASDAVKEKVQAARAAAENRKIALKQDVCQAHQEQLTERLPALSQSVNSIKKTLDSKYAQVTAIYTSGKLSVSNYADLDAQVKVAQAAANTAIANIDSSTVTIDCNNNDLGTQLDSFRATITVARSALNDYRTALVNLVSALSAAADKVEQSTTGEAQ